MKAGKFYNKDLKPGQLYTEWGDCYLILKIEVTENADFFVHLLNDNKIHRILSPPSDPFFVDAVQIK
jgi:hypothetical protein